MTHAVSVLAFWNWEISLRFDSTAGDFVSAYVTLDQLAHSARQLISFTWFCCFFVCGCVLYIIVVLRFESGIHLKFIHSKALLGTECPHAICLVVVATIIIVDCVAGRVATAKLMKSFRFGVLILNFHVAARSNIGAALRNAHFHREIRPRR